MLMRNWTPPSQIPTTPLDYHKTQRTYLRWCKVFISTLILFVLISFCIVYTLQKERVFKEDYQHKQQDQIEQQYQLSFNTYINDISNILLKISDINRIDKKFLHYIQTKTLIVLKNLDIQRKNDILVFLYKQNLIQNNQLDLHGADLNNVVLTCSENLNYLYLCGVIWSNAVFINCRLISTVIVQSHLNNARFINSSIQNASFIETNLDNSQFIHTIIINTKFNKASLIQANFLQADTVQGNHFIHADLYQAKLTNDQLEGKKISIIKHDFYHARFPNGSFGSLNSEENLIINGDAEMECSIDPQTKWKKVHSNMILTTGMIENITMNDDNWGDCSFVILTDTQVYQDINLDSYPLLIDTNNGGFSFSAFASCTESYFQILMYRSDNILHELKVYSKPANEMKSNDIKSMYLYGERQYRLPVHTRRIRIYFGVGILKANVECYFDNITFTIHQVK